MDKDELGNFLREKAQEAWAERQEPYFLANVQPQLKADGKDYRSALEEDQKLSEFARSLGTVRFIQHPQKPAIVGVIPLDAEYDIESRGVTKTPVERLKRSGVRRNERIVLEFLSLLSELDDELLKEVNISSRVLAKLIQN